MIQKGPLYENFAFEYFSSLINSGYFHFPPEQCIITKQKPFYSKDREKNIFFDLVIEIFLPEQNDPFLIFVIECKNYGGKVPVDDIEEFASKIDQIRYQKISPICITTVGFQSGGLTFAKNRGITLWRVHAHDTHEIILNRQKQRLKNIELEIQLALTDESYNNWKFGNTFIQTPNKLTLYPKDFINEIIFSQNTTALQFKKFKIQKVNVPYLSKQKISLIAEDIYNKYKSENGMLEINRILNDLNISLRITCEIIDVDTIAEINFSQKTITLFGKDLFTEEQLNFALAHEVGHFILKHNLLLKTEQQTTSLSKNVQFREAIPINIDRIEYQANFFAACLLLPETPLKEIFFRLIKNIILPIEVFHYFTLMINLVMSKIIKIYAYQLLSFLMFLKKL